MINAASPASGDWLPSVAAGFSAEDEAVLLQIFASFPRTPAPRMRATLSMVMQEDAVAPLFAALTGLVACFAEARLGLGVAARRGLPHA